MKAGGDEHTAMAVDDESSVVVAHVEGFEEVRREGMVDGRHNQEDGEDESESERHHIPTSLRRTRLHCPCFGGRINAQVSLIVPYLLN